MTNEKQLEEIEKMQQLAQTLGRVYREKKSTVFESLASGPKSLIELEELTGKTKSTVLYHCNKYQKLNLVTKSSDGNYAILNQSEIRDFIFETLKHRPYSVKEIGKVIKETPAILPPVIDKWAKMKKDKLNETIEEYLQLLSAQNYVITTIPPGIKTPLKNRMGIDSFYLNYELGEKAISELDICSKCRKRFQDSDNLVISKTFKDRTTGKYFVSKAHVNCGESGEKLCHFCGWELSSERIIEKLYGEKKTMTDQDKIVLIREKIIQSSVGGLSNSFLGAFNQFLNHRYLMDFAEKFGFYPHFDPEPVELPDIREGRGQKHNTYDEIYFAILKTNLDPISKIQINIEYELAEWIRDNVKNKTDDLKSFKRSFKWKTREEYDKECDELQRNIPIKLEWNAPELFKDKFEIPNMEDIEWLHEIITRYDHSPTKYDKDSPEKLYKNWLDAKPIDKKLPTPVEALYTGAPYTLFEKLRDNTDNSGTNASVLQVGSSLSHMDEEGNLYHPACYEISSTQKIDSLDAKMTHKELVNG